MNPDDTANPDAIINFNDPCDPADASINEFYEQIKNHPYVLEEIDKKLFAETPLHTAASAGDIRLATEIIRLKPSFAWKLDEEGLSPMHHALRNRHYSMVRRFVSINKDLVRVKGKKGITPLHQVAATAADEEQTEILSEFLAACPDSVEDLTVAGETALHIAVMRRKFEALQVLVGWLRRYFYYQPELVDSVLNWKNESGDTVLHVSARNDDHQAVAFLIKNEIKLNVKDSKGLTALDKVANADMRELLIAANALPGDRVREAQTQTLADRLKSKITIADAIAIKIGRWRQCRPTIDDTTRNAFVAVAVLVATMTYQSALSPPGGLHPPPDLANSICNTTSSIPAPAPPSLNSTTCLSNNSEGNRPGKSVMSKDDFYLFFVLNSLTLLISTIAINSLLPKGRSLIEGLMLCVLIYFLNGCLFAMEVISPFDELTGVITIVRLMTTILYISFNTMSTVVLRKLARTLIPSTREMESMPASRGNRW